METENTITDKPNEGDATALPEQQTDATSEPNAVSVDQLAELRREIAELKRAITTVAEQADAKTVPPSIDGSAGRSNATLPLTAAALSAMKPDAIARLDWNTVRDVLANG